MQLETSKTEGLSEANGLFFEGTEEGGTVMYGYSLILLFLLEVELAVCFLSVEKLSVVGYALCGEADRIVLHDNLEINIIKFLFNDIFGDIIL